MSSPAFPQGIDVSNHQGWIDWDSVRGSGQVFGFAKATEGNYFNDRWFSHNWSEMRRVGLDRGAYHFARPSSALPEQEAAFFLASVNNAGGLLPGDMLVLDLEDTNYHGGGAYGSAGNWALGFCQYIEAAVGFEPIVYWGPWWRPDDIAATRELGNYPLWIAAYQAHMPPPPAPWAQISFWQYTSSGRVPGVAGDCDQNIFNGESHRIALLGKPGVPPVEPEQPQYVVGSGILAAMERQGERPATNEHYVTPDWSEAYGEFGTKYVYIASLNKVFEYPPD